MINFLKKRLASFLPAIHGLRYVVATQKNAWLHITATCIAIFLSAWLRLSNTNFAIIFLAIGLVWTAECINTGIEVAVDLVSPNRNHLAKVAKDVSAAGVLCAAIIAVIIGFLVLTGPILARLHLAY